MNWYSSKMKRHHRSTLKHTEYLLFFYPVIFVHKHGYYKNRMSLGCKFSQVQLLNWSTFYRVTTKPKMVNFVETLCNDVSLMQYPVDVQWLSKHRLNIIVISRSCKSEQLEALSLKNKLYKPNMWTFEFFAFETNLN